MSFWTEHSDFTETNAKIKIYCIRFIYVSIKQYLIEEECVCSKKAIIAECLLTKNLKNFTYITLSLTTTQPLTYPYSNPTYPNP